MRHIYNGGDLPKKGTRRLTDERRVRTHAESRVRFVTKIRQALRHTRKKKNLAPNYPASKIIMYNLCLRRTAESESAKVQISRRGGLFRAAVLLCISVFVYFPPTSPQS